MAEQEPILQYTIEGQRPWGTRAFADGRVEALSDRSVSVTEAGSFTSTPVKRAWRPRARLSPEQVATLTELIAGSAFFELPASLGADERIQDGAVTTWTVRRDDQSHQVRAHGAGHAANPVLEELRRGFELLVAQAITRDAAQQDG